MYLKRIPGQTNEYWFTFSVPIVSVKQTSQVQIEPGAPIVACQQYDQNRCCASSLYSSFKASNLFVAVNAIAPCISASLTYVIPDIIQIGNLIISYQTGNFGEKHLSYKLEQWNKTHNFDILNNICGCVTLVQLMYSLGNVNHAVSLVGKRVFYSNYTRSFPLTIESFNLICACSDED